MGRTDTRLTGATHAERGRLASLFAELSPQQWTAPSLCEGWRNREVLAHMTMPYRLSGPRFLTGIVRAGFRFNRFADRDARTTAQRMDGGELVELYRANLRHPWQPPGGGPDAALGHDLIHGLDITEALGLPGPPPGRIALMLATPNPRNPAYFGVDLAGTRLEATDADCSVGHGEPLRLPAWELLLVITGRRALSDVAASPGDHT